MKVDREKIKQIVLKLNSVFQNVENLIRHYEINVSANQEDQAGKNKKTILETLSAVLKIEKMEQSEELKDEHLEPLLEYQKQQIDFLTVLETAINAFEKKPELKKDIDSLVDKIQESIEKESKVLT